MRFGRPPCYLLNITAALKLESRRGNAPRNARFADGAVHLPGRGTRKEDDTDFTNYHGFDSALPADDPCKFVQSVSRFVVSNRLMTSADKPPFVACRRIDCGTARAVQHR